jgi:hypothetical protein
MLRKLISNKTLSFIPKNYFSAGHHAPTPTKLDKAENKLYIILLSLY